jgi:hypothetical protein
MEGGFSFGFGGDPEELMRSLREFAERQSEAVHESQRETFATLTLNTAVELAAAGLRQVRVEGSAEEQALALRDAMRILFPEAVALVSKSGQSNTVSSPPAMSPNATPFPITSSVFR